MKTPLLMLISVVGDKDSKHSILNLNLVYNFVSNAYFICEKQNKSVCENERTAAPEKTKW